MLKGFLCARDIDPAGIAGYLSVNEETIGLYSDLFFNVRDRLEDRWYISGVIYPETGLGSILEVENESEMAERIFIRVGHEQGWKAVAKLAGLMSLAEDIPLDKSFFGDRIRIGFFASSQQIKHGIGEPDLGPCRTVFRIDDVSIQSNTATDRFFLFVFPLEII